MNYLKAEFVRTKNSTLMWFPLLGIIVGAVSTLFSAGLSADEPGLAAARWQGMYLTGLAAPLIALCAATAERREKANNFGGTAWRPIDPRATRLARLLAVWGVLAVFHLANFGATGLVTVALSGSTAGTARIVLLGLYAFVGSLGVAGIAAALARRIGMIATVLIATAVQIASGLAAESPAWVFLPPAWPIRLVLPVMETHFSLVPLAATDPLRTESPFLALALCGVWAAVGAVIAAAVPWGKVRYGAGGLRQAKNRNFAGRVRPVRAVTRAALTPGLVVALVAALAVLVLAARYPIAPAIATFVVFPLGAGLLPLFVWPAIQPAWRLMRVEFPGVGAVLVGVGMAIIAVLAGVAAILYDDATWWLLTVIVSSAIFLASLALTVRFGALWAVAAVLALVVVAVTFGGDVFAATPAWIVAVPAWPFIAGGSRFAFALVTGLALCVICGLCVRRVLRRA